MVVVLPINRYRDILNADTEWTEHVAEDGIHESNYSIDDIPQLSFQLWSPEKRQSQKDRINSMVDFILSPCIEDDFVDHEKRTLWRQKFEGKYEWFYDFYRKNALRAGIVFLELASDRIQDGYIGRASQNFYMSTAMLKDACSRCKTGNLSPLIYIPILQDSTLHVLNMLSTQYPIY